ncbi:sigma 54-interacting transcriptional regulator [Clostridium lacusfryxellense]|uniref:sigma 54-interacting transcriptional regulator n=1 Tax=Clostridium lacusfryxellense TaxID=205328 RepID=UPI001C0E7248|nr:sigma 54-interacting transcriptional regulator [Clostridium lacusfryxellense]MBU3109999.1 sigma 54-interacting transcriptional regulator [Clostridium lacusfryxellense]
MTRKEKIYNALKDICTDITYEKLKEGFAGFEATIIGEQAKVSRSNTSKELNCLLLEKCVVKIHGKPVYFIDRLKLEEILGFNLRDDQLDIKSIDILIDFKNKLKNKDQLYTDIFNDIIGADGSLKLAIKQAEAAILYPPKGLHTLLIGATGVGKNNFSEIMYKYAVESGTISKDSEFVIFNCAEYADNPNLLLSQLYGYAKGAFTGAEKEREGLIEKANGGIILLDEIHRLPPEGQEMLFMLMDKGTYRKMGETEGTRKSNVRFICATTEDINSSLLKTFIRRIPMVIKIPSLSERSLSERFELIKQFFSEESKCVKVLIRVRKDVIKDFLAYNCRGNIGQLRSDIQLTCARGFLEYKTSMKEFIDIDTSYIPDYVYEGIFNIKEKRSELLQLLQDNYNKYYEFSPHYDDNQSNIKRGYDRSNQLYNEISDKYYFYSQKGYSQEKINEVLNTYIEKYLKSLLTKCDVEKKSFENNEIFKIISPKVYYAVEKALKLAAKRLNKEFSKKVYIALAMHISSLMEHIQGRRIIDDDEINKIALNKPDEFNIAKTIHNILEEELEINIPKEEIGFIAMFLYTVDSDVLEQNDKVSVIVLAHGESTASSMMNVCNSLLETNHCKSIDMPLDQKVEDILEKAITLVKEIDEGKGVLMLVDMGSLVAFGEIITKKTNIDTRCIEMVSTPIVLEAVRKSLSPQITLEKLIDDLEKISPFMGRLIINGLEKKMLKPNGKTIITTCITGRGAAIKLAQLIKQSVPVVEEYKINIKPMNKNEFEKDYKDHLEDILAVVGTVEIKLPGVPYIPIDDVVIGDGLRKIEKLITGEIYISNDKNKHVESNEILKILSEGLTFLNPNKAYEVISNSFKELEKLNIVRNHDRIKIGYIIHCCFMIERCLIKESFPYNKVDELINSNMNLYSLLKKVLEPVEEIFGTEIPNSELGYLIDMFDLS